MLIWRYHLSGPRSVGAHHGVDLEKPDRKCAVLDGAFSQKLGLLQAQVYFLTSFLVQAFQL